MMQKSDSNGPSNPQSGLKMMGTPTEGVLSQGAGGGIAGAANAAAGCAWTPGTEGGGNGGSGGDATCDALVAGEAKSIAELVDEMALSSQDVGSETGLVGLTEQEVLGESDSEATVVASEASTSTPLKPPVVPTGGDDSVDKTQSTGGWQDYWTVQKKKKKRSQRQRQVARAAAEKAAAAVNAGGSGSGAPASTALQEHTAGAGASGPETPVPAGPQEQGTVLAGGGGGTGAPKRRHVDPTPPSQRRPPKRSRQSMPSYAAAASSALQAVILHGEGPIRGRLTEDEAALIRKGLVEALDSVEGPAPQFEASGLRDGALWVSCADSVAWDWLVAAAPKLGPEQNSYRVVRPEELEKIRVKTFIHGPRPASKDVLRRLGKQNPGLRVDSWRVTYRNDEVENPRGLYIVFSVEEDSVVELERLGWRPYYELSRITFTQVSPKAKSADAV